MSFQRQRITNSFHIHNIFIYPHVNIKKAPAFFWISNLTWQRTAWRQGMALGVTREMASETRRCVYVWSSRQILWGKNVGWRRLRSLPSSLMNGVHFNYTNAAPHVAYYTEEREKRGLRTVAAEEGIKTLTQNGILRRGYAGKTCKHEEWGSKQRRRC